MFIRILAPFFWLDCEELWLVPDELFRLCLVVRTAAYLRKAESLSALSKICKLVADLLLKGLAISVELRRTTILRLIVFFCFCFSSNWVEDWEFERTLRSRNLADGSFAVFLSTFKGCGYSLYYDITAFKMVMFLFSFSEFLLFLSYGSIDLTTEFFHSFVWLKSTSATLAGVPVFLPRADKVYSSRRVRLPRELLRPPKTVICFVGIWI